MIEMLFEYTLSVIDYSYLLFFYLRLINKKWEWKKAVPAILGIAVVQFVKDSYLDFGNLSFLADYLIVTIFLFTNSTNFRLIEFLYAQMIYGVFCASILFVVSCTIELGFDIASTWSFGIERYFFSFLVKCFTVFIFSFLYKPILKFQNVMEHSAEKIMIFIMSLILIVYSYVFSQSQNDSILIYTLLISIIMIGVIYLFYRYCLLLKKNSEETIIKHTMNITSEYVKRLEAEHNEVKKVRHDIHNQLSALAFLIDNKKYNEAKGIIEKLSNNLETKRVSLSGNVFIDAVLRQKMYEYKDKTFDLNIQVTNDFHMDGNDIISLLSNIIDNACEELNRIQYHQFSIEIKGNSTQLRIIEKNASRPNNNLRTDKNQSAHGFGLKIIKEIVRKYEGVLEISTDHNEYIISVLLLF